MYSVFAGCVNQLKLETLEKTDSHFILLSVASVTPDQIATFYESRTIFLVQVLQTFNICMCICIFEFGFGFILSFTGIRSFLQSIYTSIGQRRVCKKQYGSLAMKIWNICCAAIAKYWNLKHSALLEDFKISIFHCFRSNRLFFHVK